MSVVLPAQDLLHWPALGQFIHQLVQVPDLLHELVLDLAEQRLHLGDARDLAVAQREVDSFSTMLTDVVDPDRARSELLDVTRRTLGPDRVLLWTVDRT